MKNSKKIILAGIVSGVVLLILGILGLYATIWFFPTIAGQYFDPVFDVQSDRILLFYIHPFVVGMALSWFWARFKGILTGSFLTRGIEFGLIYLIIASFPMMLLIYSAMNISLDMVLTWLVLSMVQGVVAGLVFEKINP